MTAKEMLEDREGLYGMLSDMSVKDWDRLLDLLRVIAFAKLDDSRTKAADDIRSLLWSVAEDEEERLMYLSKTLEQIYGFANGRERRCEL